MRGEDQVGVTRGPGSEPAGEHPPVMVGGERAVTAVSAHGRPPTLFRVLINDRVIELSEGEELPFGRSPGRGQISESSTVSSVHGVIHVESESWSVTSTGRFHGFTVLDVETPSRLVIPVGAGPVRVPFARAVVAVELERHRCLLEVDASTACAEGWEGAWVSYPHRRAGVAPAGGQTVLAWESARFVDRTGRPLRWYQVLVALCEPRLRLPAAEREERIPTNQEIARRIGVTVGVVERYLDQLREALGFPRYSEQMRLGAVLLAISQGLVTPSDLAVLDAQDPEGGQ